MICDQRQLRRTLRRSFRSGLLVVLALQLSGCLILPFPTTVEPLPFPEQEMSQLVPGVTSRQKVIDLLGEPDFEGVSSSLALYGDDRRIAGVFVVAPQQAVGASPIKTGHLLVLSYDESEIVREVDLFRKGLLRNNSEICTTSGVCIKPRISNSDGVFRILDAKFYDTQENDAVAKSFDVPRDQCAVYVYLDTNFWAGNQVLVHSVGHPSPKMHVVESGFFLWFHDPGPFSLVASDQLHSGTPVPPESLAESSIEFVCQAQQAHIIKATLRWNWGEGRNNLDLTLVEPAEGRVALRRRRLMTAR